MRGHLVVNKNNLIISTVLVVLFICLFNFDIGAISLLYWGVTLGCSGLLLKWAGGWKIIRLDRFLMWYILFFCASGISVLWSINKSASIDYLKSLVVNGVILLAVDSVIREYKDISTVMRAMYIAIIANAIYLILKIDWTEIGINRMGIEYTGVGWNANSIGLTMVWGIALAIIIPSQQKHKPSDLVWLAPLLVVLIFSGSRKAWLAALLVCVLGLFAYDQKHLIKNILIALCVTAAIVYLVFNIPLLYELGGKRFEELILGVFNEGEVDHGTYLRQEYVRLGMEWFGERPLLGYGLNCFRELLSQSYLRKDTYSHNNYVELLVNGGIVITAIFYSIYFWGIKKGYKLALGKRKINTEKSRMILFFTGILVIQLGLQMGMVAYADLLTLLFVMLHYKVIHVDTQK